MKAKRPRPRKPETLIRKMDVALRNAKTYLVDLDMRGECVVSLIEARSYLPELRQSLKVSR